MIALLLLSLVQQRQAPTVGDTIWVSRTVAVPAGAEVRPANWEPEGDLVLLGRPVLEGGAGTVTVRYPVTAWTAGEHRFEVPGPIVVGADGHTDSLPAERAVVQVASVLPAGAAADHAPIVGASGLVVEAVTTPWPLVVLLGASLLAFLPVAWWWRRRRAPVSRDPAAGTGETVIPIGAWADDGEVRAVAAGTVHQVRESLVAILPGAQPGLVTRRLMAQAESRRPALPVEELDAVLRSLEAAAYAPLAPADVESLATRAQVLRARLRGPSA